MGNRVEIDFNTPLCDISGEPFTEAGKDDREIKITLGYLAKRGLEANVPGGRDDMKQTYDKCRLAEKLLKKGAKPTDADAFKVIALNENQRGLIKKSIYGWSRIPMTNLGHPHPQGAQLYYAATKLLSLKSDITDNEDDEEESDV